MAGLDVLIEQQVVEVELVTEEIDVVLQDQNPIDVVIEEGLQGKPGPRGPTGPPGGTVIIQTAVVAISGHRVVRAVVGGVDYATNADAQHADAILGVTVNAADSGEEIRIQASGEITDPSWSFEIGPVFVGAGGLLVQPVPSGAAFIRQIAQAIAPDRLLILNRPPIFS